MTNNWRSDFLYDGRGRLRTRKEFNWSAGTWSLSTETRYLYEGMRVVQERNGSDLPQVTYTRGTDLSGGREGAGGIGGLLGRSHGYNTGTGAWATHHFYHADGNGNVTYLVNTSRTLGASYRYDAYGRTTSTATGTLAPSDNVYRFSSKELHAKSGLYYYGYRLYDPNLQRWINRDPIGERGGISLYGFVANSPLDLIDPLGLLTKEECAALHDQIFGKAAALLDDLRHYDPVEDFKGISANRSRNPRRSSSVRKIRCRRLPRLTT